MLDGKAEFERIMTVLQSFMDRCYDRHQNLLMLADAQHFDPVKTAQYSDRINSWLDTAMTTMAKLRKDPSMELYEKLMEDMSGQVLFFNEFADELIEKLEEDSARIKAEIGPVMNRVFDFFDFILKVSEKFRKNKKNAN